MYCRLVCDKAYTFLIAHHTMCVYVGTSVDRYIIIIVDTFYLHIVIANNILIVCA